MGDHSAIEWTKATWNPIRGCSRVSEGCRNCYAEAIASRFSRPGQAYYGLAKVRVFKDHPGRWTGEVRFIEDALDLPLRWKTPRRIFVNSMSDLFHEKVQDGWILRIFMTMIEADQHTYQILTKRPERMARWVASFLSPALTTAVIDHIWLGVSVEDQATADERIPLLLQTPAAVRWVSYEPALGPVDFWPWLSNPSKAARLLDGKMPMLDWIVVGGESGPGARPFDLAWARQTIAQCRAAGVPVFVKQLGAQPFFDSDYGTMESLPLRDRKGGDPAEWPEDLRVRKYPRAT